jgi:hypothetical protein
MTSPAAPVPELPFNRMRREEEILSARRKERQQQQGCGEGTEFHRPRDVHRDHQNDHGQQNVAEISRSNSSAGRGVIIAMTMARTPKGTAASLNV